MSQLTKHLENLVRVDGISIVIVVGRDGFVIDGVANGATLDTEAVGAVVSTGLGSAEVMGNELNVGKMTQAMLEYKDGIVVTNFLGEDAILAAVADLKANLGNVRFQVKKIAPEILKAL